MIDTRRERDFVSPNKNQRREKEKKKTHHALNSAFRIERRHDDIFLQYL